MGSTVAVDSGVDLASAGGESPVPLRSTGDSPPAPPNLSRIGFELRDYRGGVGREGTVIESVGIIARQHPVNDRLTGGWQPRVHCFLKVMFEAMDGGSNRAV